MQPKLVYTIPQAAEAAQTGKTKLYEEIKNGRLPIVKVGRKTLIRHEALERWLKECEQATSFYDSPEVTFVG